MSQSRELPVRDYTGVATRDLRKLILERVDDLDGFAVEARIPPRSFYRIMAEEYQFTNLAIADLVCCHLDLVLNNELQIIPAASFASCCKMAADEFWLRNENPTRKQLHERARELEALRLDVLGPPTQAQRVNVDRERRWQTERYQRKAAA